MALIRGVTPVDFGSFPGRGECSTVIVGEPDVKTTSFVRCWVTPVATSDHSADEHVLEEIRVMATTYVAGVGFTIRAMADAPGAMVYGKFSVAWEVSP